MPSTTGDWRASVDDLDARLLDGYQSGFPLEERPFRTVAERLNAAAEGSAAADGPAVDEDAVVERVFGLLDRGLVRRFGPVLNPPVIGASTLAALRVPEERFDAVAAAVNDHEQVNHNYRRDHEWNMWFVVTAGSLDRRDAILAEIEAATGLEPLVLPMLTDYYIDLEFPVVNGDRFARESGAATGVEATTIDEAARTDLSSFEADLLLAIQTGFPRSATPYRDLAADLDAPVEDVLEAIRRLREVGCIKRVGCVVDHVATGFDNNCMVVWDVPDDELDERGRAAGALPYVTLCYHRPRRPERDWPYNLFTMIHGREAAAVDEKIDELATEHLPVPHERLYSTGTLKQTGARYEALLD